MSDRGDHQWMSGRREQRRHDVGSSGSVENAQLLKGRFALALTAAALLVVAVGVAPSQAAKSGASSAYIRTNLIGYPIGVAGRAYLMASGAETGATFAIKDSSGTTVSSGSIGSSLGPWSSSYPDVYAIDF